ncbi:MAG: ribonuclease HI family protein [Candidatus Omnitrophota bacterium]|nr:MAG: ribonuclease HI family protein [Candidatus Omnitrophota bacterium]
MGRFHIYIDGAARGNPGPAGIGIVITDEKGKIIHTISKYLGQTTNNIAEYTALIFGMEEVRNKKAKDIIINTDSQLLARQLGGEYKVKSSSLKDLYNKVNTMLKSFDEVRVNQIGREQNKHADKLANKAIDNSVKGKKRGTSYILKSKSNIEELFGH